MSILGYLQIAISDCCLSCCSVLLSHIHKLVLESSWKCHTRHRLLQQKPWCQLPRCRVSATEEDFTARHFSLFSFLSCEPSPSSGRKCGERCVAFAFLHLPRLTSDGREICKAGRDVTWQHFIDTRTRKRKAAIRLFIIQLHVLLLRFFLSNGELFRVSLRLSYICIASSMDMTVSEGKAESSANIMAVSRSPSPCPG